MWDSRCVSSVFSSAPPSEEVTVEFYSSDKSIREVWLRNLAVCYLRPAAIKACCDVSVCGCEIEGTKAVLFFVCGGKVVKVRALYTRGISACKTPTRTEAAGAWWHVSTVQICFNLYYWHLRKRCSGLLWLDFISRNVCIDIRIF